ncbi:MAG TPA: cyclic nucleotide-binding domain-containing protein, partial [Anaerolineales bacterium]|nr:cyclic nucleotide-binding domain-containing protein [Anaerolineales bacterium]
MIDPIVFDDVPLFKLLDEEEKKVLAQQVSMRDFKKGQRLFKTGDPGGVSYIIQKGLVHVSIQDANKETIVIDIADEGGLVGMSSLLAEENHLTTAVAIEDTTAIELDRGDIIALVTSKPLAGLDMMTIVEKHLREAHNLMRTRVARNLNEEMEEKETLGEKAADAVARFGGSWMFVTTFGVILVVYVTINSIL